MSKRKFSKEFKLRLIKEHDEKGVSFYANPGVTPIFHSDRGFQYTSKEFHQKILDAGMTQSMSRVAHCIDNGPMMF